jgi:hypothetical protein
MQSLIARPVRSWSWAGVATGLVWLVACGGDDGAGPGPDASPPPPDASAPAPITITTYPDGAPYTGQPGNPPLVAFQDGDGAWTALSGTAGVYQAVAHTPRYAIAVGCDNPEHATVSQYYQTTADATNVKLPGCPPPAAQVHVTITLANLQPTETAVVTIGRSVIGLFSAPDTTTLTADVAQGAEDVFVVVVGGADGARAVQRAARLGRVPLDHDQPLALDAGAAAPAPEIHGARVVGAETVEVVTRSSRYSTGTARFNVELSQLAPPDSYLTVNAAARQPGDLASASVTGARTLPDGNLYTRFAQQTMATPIDVVLELPARFLAAPPKRGDVASPSTSVTLLPTKDLLAVSAYAVALDTAAPSGATGQRVTMNVTSGWIGSLPFVPMIVPDLSALPGWTANMALQRDRPLTWSITRQNRSTPLDGPEAEGLLFESSISGVVAP